MSKSGCEIVECQWYIDGKCEDPFDYVDPEGDAVCGRRPEAIIVKTQNAPITEAAIREAANHIADDLLTNGNGDTARRLVLRLQDGSDGGGWCRKSIIDTLTKHLQSLRRADGGG